MFDRCFTRYCGAGNCAGLRGKISTLIMRVITVRRSSLYLPGKGVCSKIPQKTAILSEVLRFQIRRCSCCARFENGSYKCVRVGDQWQNSRRIFTTWTGAPINPDTVSGWFPLISCARIIYRLCISTAFAIPTLHY